MLHTNFNLFKDFIECEVSLRAVYCNSEERVKLGWKRKYLPFYSSIYPYRNSQLGLSHFEWIIEDAKLHGSPPDEYAVEVIAIYKWWVNTRPARVKINPIFPTGTDPTDIFGSDIDRTTKEYAEYKRMADEANIQHDEWYDEDTSYLVRLMKIRRSLWT
jgi:hypothetical protein